MKLTELELSPPLWALALMAAHAATAKGCAPRVELEAWATLANSEDEAFELGIERALELWPESQGWDCHAARTLEIKLNPETVDLVLEPKFPTLTEPEIKERIM